LARGEVCVIDLKSGEDAMIIYLHGKLTRHEKVLQLQFIDPDASDKLQHAAPKT
jgi:predicted esterase YcpF (UPF0227 family)